VLSEVVRQVTVHCHERGLVLDQLREFFVHAAHSFLALCKRQKLAPPPYSKSGSRAARQIEELRAEIESLKAKLSKRSQAGQSGGARNGDARPSGETVTEESACASPCVETPRGEGDVPFTEKTLAAVLVRLDRLTHPQLRLVLDAALGRLAGEARCGWLFDTARGLGEDEASLLLAVQLKSQGAPAMLAAAGGRLPPSELVALVLAFLPRLGTPEKAECFRAVLSTMEVPKVLEVRRGGGGCRSSVGCGADGARAERCAHCCMPAWGKSLPSLRGDALYNLQRSGDPCGRSPELLLLSSVRARDSYRSLTSLTKPSYFVTPSPAPAPATRRWQRRCCASRPTAPKCSAASSATCQTNSGGGT
jgi:hypothetical protein